MIAVDTSALIAILNDEPWADSLNRRMVAAGGAVISRATAVELNIVVLRKWGRADLARMALLLDYLKVEAVDVDAEQERLAIEAYSRYGRGTGSRARLNFGDCFAYALAKAKDLPLLFVGDNFVHTDLRRALA